MSKRSTKLRTALLGASALVSAAALMASPAAAQDARQFDFDMPAQPLTVALKTFGATADQQLIFSESLVKGRAAPPLKGAYTPDQALAMLLEGSGLVAERTPSGVVTIQSPADPQGASAGGGAEVEALIVTAQKREEDIQDVPIAISAFTQEQLTDRQVAGGPDLMTQVPNMTFTKTNFSSYSIQIRGIGTQAISATTDPAVAVAFNNTPFIRNRFFEQEFYDLQRVEVLRGPQGTLYGRNATAGVVNIISQKPKFSFESKLSADVSNYSSTRLEGMINVPLVEDKVALRLAGAWTKREGFVTNEITGNPIDGRDLWSTRLSLRFSPNDRIDANLIWEHFEEDDDRLRSGKQLCQTHEVTSITAIHPDGTVRVFQTPNHFQTLPEEGQPNLFAGVQGMFSQGCSPASLYSPDSFGTPNGLSVPYYIALAQVGLPIALTDPYVNRTQSHDLRVIESTVDPGYQAKSDLVELQLSFDLTDALTLSSETAWATDFIFSTQDLNRFNTASGAWDADSNFLARGILKPGPNGPQFCDPQIGCADRLVGVDLSTAESSQFSQELRLSSAYDGRFNFSLGANFLRYDTEDKYYVFFNSLSMFAARQGTGQYVSGVTDNTSCLSKGLVEPAFDYLSDVTGCIYIDPNPIGSLNDLGHNYFLSRNPYKLISYAVFGESYFNITDNLKVTAGLRWTVDKKEAPRRPSWVLASRSVGYPVMEVIEQEWREPTGRLTIDWKPDLSFTDESLFYASYAHGYKAGGSNPPPAGLVMYCAACQTETTRAAIVENGATHPKTFDAEFVDAFELGAKNTFFDGRLTLNTAAFYYDYTGYQISQIVNRSAVNLNFDATVWGLEIEADWRPLENLKLGFKGGYENTKVGDDMQAIDIMDRTAGKPGWLVVSPFPTFPSNCVLPAFLFSGVSGYFNGAGGTPGNPILVNLGNPGGGGLSACELAYVLGVDPVTRLPYVANPTVASHSGALLTHPGYPGWNPLDESQGHNSGEGFYKDLSGNELPNAPNYTATITADYTVPLPSDWLMTLHTDLYYQSEAWTRIFNTEGYDKLKAYTNVNLAAIFTNEEAGWKVMAYVKNVFDRDSITGAFLFSDDTGLTTNVFLTEPRLYGLRVTREWSGGPWWTGANPNHAGPYPFTVELGGQVQRHDAPFEHLAPSFVSQFSSVTDPAGVQDSDLDWGDGRDVRLVYRPVGSPWRAALGVRFGKTYTDLNRRHREEAVGPTVCFVPPSYPIFVNRLCDPEYVIPGYEYLGPGYLYSSDALAQPVNWTDSTSRRGEEHMIADFAVGRDVGLGMLSEGKSSLSLGLRYAKLQSAASATMRGITDMEIPEGFFKYPSFFSQHSAELDADRQFEGVGPTLSWEAGKSLIGDERAGHVDLNWSVAGGVLFGKQKTSITGPVESAEFSGNYYYSARPLTTILSTTLDTDRNDSVTVPVLNLSLGLSYEVGRINIGAGYRWERYFDVLDVGFDEKKDADRTIDGPYFKLAVGFGG